MAQNMMKHIVVGVGVLGLVAGLLVMIQVPSANQYHETTLSAAGVGVLLILFGIKTLAQSRQ